MKTRLLPVDSAIVAPLGLPDAAELAVLRAWHAGLSARKAVERYLGERRALGQSSRGILGRIRRQLAAFARQRQREDL
ncbi:integrase, partial [Chromohalobacter sp. HP20-39]|nr:integrase [Chromohalobacter sp. HP20-39]